MAEGMPSIRNSHCHARSPPTPDIFAMIRPEMGPAMTPDKGFAHMKSATILARCLRVYQNVR